MNNKQMLHAINTGNYKTEEEHRRYIRKLRSELKKLDDIKRIVAVWEADIIDNDGYFLNKIKEILKDDKQGNNRIP